jgi:hypothetical protein
VDSRAYPTFDPTATWTGTSDAVKPAAGLATTDIVLHAGDRPAGCVIAAGKLLWVRLTVQAMADSKSVGQYHGDVSFFAMALFNR